MTRPTVTYPDAERLTVDHLTPLVTADVGIAVPPAWKPGSTPHLLVAWDGTPNVDRFIAQHATIRLTARAATPTAAKALAQEASARMLVGPWPTGITNVTPLTGPFPARDPQTKAELASVTLRVTVRSTPLVGS